MISITFTKTFCQILVLLTFYRQMDAKIELTESNHATRLQRSKRLLKQYPAENADFIWFTDEKIFTVARLKNTQNDRMYAPVTAKKRDRYPQHACSVHTRHSHSL